MNPHLSSAALTMNDHHIKAERERRVLIVSKDVLLLLDVEDTLESMGLTDISRCIGASSAMNQIQLRLPDLAVVDLDFKAEKTIQLLKALEALNVPITYLSADHEMIDFPPLVSNHFIILKPFSQGELKTKVEMMLLKSE